ncbi:hypothetical protein [Candidatus Nitrotoga sp. 1052]|uniref:hypothetical protein n=1 Tax=Candidatus Nitrotoga sp. 1052 TaxID=2886964 RepID=UPI001EF70818|nr:hypothetical protein [Candidatus Nitrotoga sp. 1052]CAH1087703.1 conserved hypothetical protein [Candidatus Nitrotoga sp. 1052]
MAEKINWNFVVQALNGPSVSGSDTMEVEAYDKIKVTITAGATQQVNLVPSGTVSLLVINPAVPDADLSYKVGAKVVALDSPHVLIGAGAVSLLGGAANLSFTNNTAADATIEILLGRDATP